MPDWETLLTRLENTPDQATRLALTQLYAPLPVAFFQALKDRIRAWVEIDSLAALRLSEIGLELAESSATLEGPAYTWWARGNALLFLGELDTCLDAYSTALSLLSTLGRVDLIAQVQTNCMLPLMWTGRLAEAQAMGRNALAVLIADGETRAVANLLLNLGACARRLGDHAAALAQAQQAAAIFTRLGDIGQAARCWITQAVALEQLDRFTSSEDLLQQAMMILAEQGKWADWARAALNIGILRARLADYQTALHWMSESRRAFLQASIEMDAAVADLYRAQCYLDVQLLPEALALGAELMEAFSRFNMPRQVARAALVQAEAYARQGQHEAAQQQLERARQIFRLEGDAVELALVDLRRVVLLQASGCNSESLCLAVAASEALDVHRYPLRHAEAHLLIAAACESLGRIDEAQTAYQVAWVAGSHAAGLTEPPPILAYRIAYARGVIAEAAGDRALARGEYGQAIAYLERINRGLALDELRGGYLTDKRPVYEAAVRLALEDDRLEDAFHYAELARAGALREFLTGKQPTDVIGDTDAVNRADARARWTWRAHALLHPVDLLAEVDEEYNAETQAAQLRELAELERELMAAEASAEVTKQEAILGLVEIQKYLPDGAALLAFEHIADRLLVFVVTAQQVHVAWLGSLTELRWAASRLGHALEEVSLFTDPADVTLLEEDLLVDLQMLYRAVLARPLAQLPQEITRLVIIPCDTLRSLPLEALHDGTCYMVERYSISYLPAASFLAVLPEDQPAPGRAVLLAYSWEERLPLATTEVAAIARILEAGATLVPTLVTETRATESALRELAGQAGLLHIATHGVFRADAPLFSALYLADGPFPVHKVYELDLSHTALVTLSGCQTGLGQGRGGEVLGLAHACFFAGAPTLVVSRWRVDDACTDQLMQDFYAALIHGLSVAGALQKAQRTMLAHYPHAGYWAAFAVWGRGWEALW